MPITLFDNILTELTDHEKETIVPMIIDTLSFKTADNKVTSKNLSGWLKALGENVSEIRVRKIISYISGLGLKKGSTSHLGDKIIIATGNGYYVTEELAEVDKQIESLKDRIANMLFRVDGITAQRNSLAHKQKKIA